MTDELLICARCGRAFHGQAETVSRYGEPDLYPDMGWCWRCGRWVMVLRTVVP